MADLIERDVVIAAFEDPNADRDVIADYAALRWIWRNEVID